MKTEKQKLVNDLKRGYFDEMRKINWNAISTTRGGPAHTQLITSICLWAAKNNLVYCTEAYMNSGGIMDIVIPGIVRPFLEILDSEEKKVKTWPPEIENLLTRVKVSDPFKLL